MASRFSRLSAFQRRRRAATFSGVALLVLRCLRVLAISTSAKQASVAVSPRAEHSQRKRLVAGVALLEAAFVQPIALLVLGSGYASHEKTSVMYKVCMNMHDPVFGEYNDPLSVHIRPMFDALVYEVAAGGIRVGVRAHKHLRQRIRKMLWGWNADTASRHGAAVSNDASSTHEASEAQQPTQQHTQAKQRTTQQHTRDEHTQT
jgi:hypothetical protein